MRSLFHFHTFTLTHILDTIQEQQKQQFEDQMKLELMNWKLEKNLDKEDMEEYALENGKQRTFELH
jgi:hypothetical protein